MYSGRKFFNEVTLVATLQEIAKVLGMSVSTVSRVVNQKRYVKESTRERVMEAVERYNYIPDNAARSLKTGQTRTIGVIIPVYKRLFRWPAIPWPRASGGAGYH